jgi:hypothetical protein
MYSLVTLVDGLRPETYRDVLVSALLLANQIQKDTNLLKDPAFIKQVETTWARWDGKLFPGGQSTMWAMRFRFEIPPISQIIKCFSKINPYLLVNHVVSAEKFVKDFSGPIHAKKIDFLVKPAKNIALARIKGEDQFLFHVQQFSDGHVIPPSVPIGEICKLISAKGYVVDAYPRNWRLNDDKTAKYPLIEYIDELFWNNIYQHQERIQSLTSQLDKFQYPL